MEKLNKEDLLESHLLSMGMLMALGGDKLNGQFETYYNQIKELIKEHG